MSEFWTMGFQRPCSLCPCLLGVQPWFPQERKLIELTEGYKVIQRENNLPEPTGCQAAKHMKEAISGLSVLLTHQLKAATFENPGDRFTDILTLRGRGRTPLSWQSNVCEVMPPSHLEFSPRLFLSAPCCIQRPYTSPLPSAWLGTPGRRAMSGGDLVGCVWGFCFRISPKVAGPWRLYRWYDNILKEKKCHMKVGLSFLNPSKTSYLVLLKDSPITK